MRIRLNVIHALALSVAGAVATPIGAGNCGHEQCWGAVGIGPGTLWGWSAGKPSEAAAVARLLESCPDCDNIHSFFDTCGAIARGNDGIWGTGWGDSKELALYYAVNTCLQFGSGCEPAVWSCSQ